MLQKHVAPSQVCVTHSTHQPEEFFKSAITWVSDVTACDVASEQGWEGKSESRNQTLTLGLESGFSTIYIAPEKNLEV